MTFFRPRRRDRKYPPEDWFTGAPLFYEPPVRGDPPSFLPLPVRPMANWDPQNGLIMQWLTWGRVWFKWALGPTIIKKGWWIPQLRWEIIKMLLRVRDSTMPMIHHRRNPFTVHAYWCRFFPQWWRTPVPTAPLPPPTPGYRAAFGEMPTELLWRVVLEEPALAHFYLLAGLLMLLSALTGALTHWLLPHTGLHRHRTHDRRMPVVIYPPGSEAIRLRERLLDRWSRRPPRRLLWWTLQLRTLPQRLLGPVPTDWFVVPLTLGAIYSICYCLGWGYSWWVFHSGHHPLLVWDERFTTWYRDRLYLRMMRRSYGTHELLWEAVNTRYRRRYHTLWWEKKYFRRTGFKHRTFGRILAVPVGGYPRRQMLRYFYLAPFAFLAPQVLALLGYWRELRRLRRWHSWAFPSYDFHWEVDTVRNWVRTVGMFSLVLVPAHLMFLLRYVT